MKKILPLLLALACLLTCVLGASAAASLCFVAVNDTIPLTLSGSDKYQRALRGSQRSAS